jgi:hypothetical protein
VESDSVLARDKSVDASVPSTTFGVVDRDIVVAVARQVLAVVRVTTRASSVLNIHIRVAIAIGAK